MIEKNHPPIKYGNTGVLIVNLGTPDSTNWFDIRKYLKEFLSDRRVIEVNPLIWQIILNLFYHNISLGKKTSAIIHLALPPPQASIVSKELKTIGLYFSILII